MQTYTHPICFYTLKLNTSALRKCCGKIQKYNIRCLIRHAVPQKRISATKLTQNVSADFIGSDTKLVQLLVNAALKERLYTASDVLSPCEQISWTLFMLIININLALSDFGRFIFISLNWLFYLFFYFLSIKDFGLYQKCLMCLKFCFYIRAGTQGEKSNSGVHQDERTPSHQPHSQERRPHQPLCTVRSILRWHCNGIEAQIFQAAQ